MAHEDDAALPPLVVNVDALPEEGTPEGPWQNTWKVLTPGMKPRGGLLGASITRLPPGKVGCPLHHHMREDEFFYVIEGRGVLRYGDTVREIGPGDAISCPHGTGVGHQIANPFDAELVYLAVGLNDPDEVCVYPDTGKVLVRSLRTVGWLEKAPYIEKEPVPCKVFDLWDAQTREGG